MRILKLTFGAASLLLLAACVTINIYFPAAQAEAAAGKIVEDILGAPNGSEEAVPKGGDKGAALDRDTPILVAEAVLEFFVPSAQAAQPDFNVNTPEIRKLRAEMKRRHKRLAPFYANGAIGFTRDALVTVHDASAISLKERSRVRSLVSAENRDRNALYRAIAEANGHPEWEPDVRAVFARTWAREARRGWWYQTSKGQWKQK